MCDCYRLDSPRWPLPVRRFEVRRVACRLPAADEEVSDVYDHFFVGRLDGWSGFFNWDGLGEWYPSDGWLVRRKFVVDFAQHVVDDLG
jgi:hypothetical protein